MRGNKGDKKKPREAVCQAGADSRQVRRIQKSSGTQAFPGAFYLEPGSFDYSAR
jgi:hypothetical protein